MSQLNKHNAATWQLAGDLDRHSLPGLWEELNQLPADATLEIDLSQLKRVDSAGLAGLLQLQINAQKLACQLSFTSAPSQALSLAQMSNVANMLSLK